jgi:hypothetical protein
VPRHPQELLHVAEKGGRNEVQRESVRIGRQHPSGSKGRRYYLDKAGITRITDSFFRVGSRLGGTDGAEAREAREFASFIGHDVSPLSGHGGSALFQGQAPTESIRDPDGAVDRRDLFAPAWSVGWKLEAWPDAPGAAHGKGDVGA